jgi:hypothetical protein
VSGALFFLDSIAGKPNGAPQRRFANVVDATVRERGGVVRRAKRVIEAAQAKRLGRAGHADVLPIDSRWQRDDSSRGEVDVDRECALACIKLLSYE